MKVLKSLALIATLIAATSSSVQAKEMDYTGYINAIKAHRENYCQQAISIQELEEYSETTSTPSALRIKIRCINLNNHLKELLSAKNKTDLRRIIVKKGAYQEI
jgi:hypothetical protein